MPLTYWFPISNPKCASYNDLESSIRTMSCSWMQSSACTCVCLCSWCRGPWWTPACWPCPWSRSPCYRPTPRQDREGAEQLRCPDRGRHGHRYYRRKRWVHHKKCSSLYLSLLLILFIFLSLSIYTYLQYIYIYRLPKIKSSIAFCL